MSGVSEAVVREYFEALGFLVTQPRKYAVPVRPKTADEEIDLLVVNPTVVATTRPAGMVWSTEDVRGIGRALVAVRGWHTERFYAAMFEQSPDILRFAEEATVHAARKLLGSEDVLTVLCLPRLPASDELKTKTLEALRARGVDGVLLFGTLLADLIHGVDVSRSYEKSDLLQLLRVLKAYDLLKHDQMELFETRRRRGPGKKPRRTDAEVESAEAAETAPGVEAVGDVAVVGDAAAAVSTDAPAVDATAARNVQEEAPHREPLAAGASTVLSDGDVDAAADSLSPAGRGPG